MAIYALLLMCIVASVVVVIITMYKLRNTMKEYENKKQKFRATVQKFKDDVHDAMTEFTDDIKAEFGRTRFKR